MLRFNRFVKSYAGPEYQSIRRERFKSSAKRSRGGMLLAHVEIIGH